MHQYGSNRRTRDSQREGRLVATSRHMQLLHAIVVVRRSRRRRRRCRRCRRNERYGQRVRVIDKE